RVVEIASDEETRALDEKVERMRAALQEGETDRVLALDMEFHGLLFHLARHERLSRVWVRLESQHRLFNALYAKTLTPETVRENLSHGVEEHTQITRAVKNRDAQTACGLLSQHVKRFAELAQRALRALYSGEIPSRDA
ncbi:MAG: FCD domain-containing protein, partial [Nitrospinota bacterium]